MRTIPKVFALFICLCVSFAFADTHSLLILHTNDIHGHVKADPLGQGGLPYVSAFVKEMRAQRGDLLLLDGGDVMRKGDLIAEKTEHRILYEAMKKIGYTAGAMGNHDNFHGYDHLRECSEIAGMPILCLNSLDDTGSPRFAPSTIVECNGLKVALIGLTTLAGGAFKSIDKCGEQLRLEAERLENQVDLTVAVVHIGRKECILLSEKAPTIDVFVSGHTHEALHEAALVPETGALIVQAGQYAQYVGVLDLTVDPAQKKVITAESRLVSMDPETVTPDQEMIAWLDAEEERIFPGAGEIVGETGQVIQIPDLVRIASAALQWKAGADIAFCHTFVMRSNQREGAITANSIFQSAGQRGDQVVLTELSGEQIRVYLNCLSNARQGKTAWYGFSGKMEKADEAGKWNLVSDLEMAKNYQVAIPLYQWENLMGECAEPDSPLATLPKTPPIADYSVADAMTDYLREVKKSGGSVEALLATLN